MILDLKAIQSKTRYFFKRCSIFLLATKNNVLEVANYCTLYPKK